MLEFIVLGQIPGTRLVITFQWVVVMATLAAGYAALHVAHKHQVTISPLSIEEITL